MAVTRKVSVKLFSRDQVMKTFIADGQGTKRALAEIIAKRFPEQLGFQWPPKRKLWMSEDSRMNIFDAVALALLPHLCRRHRDVTVISKHMAKSLSWSVTIFFHIVLGIGNEKNSFTPLCKPSP
jgi:hypothetical protein